MDSRHASSKPAETSDADAGLGLELAANHTIQSDIVCKDTCGGGSLFEGSLDTEGTLVPGSGGPIRACQCAQPKGEILRGTEPSVEPRAGGWVEAEVADRPEEVVRLVGFGIIQPARSGMESLRQPDADSAR